MRLRKYRKEGVKLGRCFLTVMILFLGSFSQADLISLLSEKLHSSCPANPCPTCNVYNNQVGNQAGKLVQVAMLPSRSQLFKDMAHDQIDQTTCDYHYMSQLDYRGDNDWARTCGRAHSGVSTGIGKSIETVMANVQDPLKPNNDVKRKQSQVLEDMADKIILLKKIRAEESSIHTWDRLQRCAKDNGWDDTYCPRYVEEDKELRKAEEMVYSSLWNGSNTFVRKYAESAVNTKDGINFSAKPQDLEKQIDSFKQHFVSNGLDKDSIGSFQRQVIEPSKDQLCGDISFYKAQENSGDLAVDKNNPNAEDKKRDRKYKKLLTMAAMSKMDSDPAFKEKYGALRCSLDIDYGEKSQAAETVINGGTTVALVLLAIAQPELSGLAESSIEALGFEFGEVAGTAVAIGVDGANAYHNMKSSCLDNSKVPKTIRSASCSVPQKPFSVNDQIKSLNFETQKGNCALDVMLSALPAVRFLSEANALEWLGVKQADYLSKSKVAAKNLKNDLEVLGTDTNIGGDLRAVAARNVKNSIGDTVRGFKYELVGKSDAELEDLMKKWFKQHVDDKGYVVGETNAESKWFGDSKKSLGSWEDYKRQLDQGNAQPLINMHANSTINVQMMEYQLQARILTPENIQSFAQTAETLPDQLLIHEYTERYFARMGSRLPADQRAALTRNLPYVERSINTLTATP